MYKFLVLLLIFFGIYIGVNYGDEVQQIMDTDVAVQVQDKLEMGKEKITEQLNELKDYLTRY
jgi:hypothetical protein